MPQHTPGQARVIDPILTNVAQGYKHNRHVGMALFPRVGVGQRGGQVIEFGRESFRRYNLRRAPGADSKRIQFGYLGKPFALVQDALDGKVPWELMQDAAAVPGINLGTRAVNGVMAIVSKALEIEQAEMARDAAAYDADHKIDLTASSWHNPAVDPGETVETAKEAIRASTGMRPNTLVLSANAAMRARRNPKVKEQFKYTSSASITNEMLKGYFNVDRLEVGEDFYINDDDENVDIWGNDAILAYVNDSSIDNEQPSYGYTYTLEGSPIVEEPYNDRKAKSWIYPMTYDRAPVLSGITSGYLLIGAGAAFGG
ncbi:MAG: major capsid protein [Sinimarinibacterium flocculans]|jgi:hypothetical protein|uniref:major capsid protein n=1 Tax=Sinimarinibacterium flocculans TaxID=985250 RepID=UPI003C617E78